MVKNQDLKIQIQARTYILKYFDGLFYKLKRRIALSSFLRFKKNI